MHIAFQQIVLFFRKLAHASNNTIKMKVYYFGILKKIQIELLDLVETIILIKMLLE